MYMYIYIYAAPQLHGSEVYDTLVVFLPCCPVALLHIYIYIYTPINISTYIHIYIYIYIFVAWLHGERNCKELAVVPRLHRPHWVF